MKTQKKISIVVPVYKSETCVQALVDQVTNCLDGEIFELILVNDCSPDNSWEAIVKAQTANPHVIAINLRKNAGQDNAIMAGFSVASGDYVVIMDDDLQHNPADIPRLIAQMVSTGADVCFAKFATKKQKLWKNIGSWFNGKMAEIIINKPATIYLSPFKVIRKAVVDEIVKYLGPYPYVDGIIFTVTQNVTQLRTEHHQRHSGQGNYTLGKSIAVWLKLMTSFSVFPLRLAILVGVCTSVAGFIFAVYLIGRYFIVGESVEGWTSLMVMVLILSGLNLIALGGVGEYVGRSYIQLNRKPQYSIKQVLKQSATASEASIPEKQPMPVHAQKCQH